MKYTLGLDYGTDSVRCVIVDVENGAELASATSPYKRWAEGKYSTPSKNIYRQHPQDYIDGLVEVVTNCVQQLSKEQVQNIIGIGVDTTGSTPAPVNANGIPLALLEGFEENPNAMFHLWKDHSSNEMAEKINAINTEKGWDYLKYVGGFYSSEWFWSKAAYTSSIDDSIKENAVSWVEHCDWMTFLLSGGESIEDYKRSRCANGHKGLWHEEWNGVPEVLIQEIGLTIDLTSFKETYTSDKVAGTLSEEWATKLGLPIGIPIAVGALDAHMGAVGGKIKPNQLSKVIGTSTCDMMVSAPEDLTAIKGISGQVDGSIIPNYIGYEAGQSAFGDLYAWFKKASSGDDDFLVKVSEEAAQVADEDCKELAIDWFNGRRTPDVDFTLKGGIINLSLASTQAHIYKALVEATCFGSKSILERMKSEGLKIDSVVALGGIAQKSSFVMQNMADILGLEIFICDSMETCALGSAMYAAVAAEAHPDLLIAMDKMAGDYKVKYTPNLERKGYLEAKYEKYKKLGDFLETLN